VKGRPGGCSGFAGGIKIRIRFRMASKLGLHGQPNPKPLA